MEEPAAAADEMKTAATTHCCPNRERIDDPAKGLHVDVYRGLFASVHLHNSDDDNWHRKLLSKVQWHRVKYKSQRFGRECETPCWTSFYGGRPEYKPYTPVPSWFQPLVDQVTSHLSKGGKKVQFNAFLLRLYFDGNDEIAWHTDGRTFLGEEPTIASLSFGCKATFQLRRMNDVWPCADGSKSTEGCVDTNTPIRSFELSDGDLLVMRGKTQKHWHHRVPKEKGRGVRLNINFRYVMPGKDAERGQRTYYKFCVYGDCPIDRTPPSWAFDDIMKKRGGMMNFVQRGVKRKAVDNAANAKGNDARLKDCKGNDAQLKDCNESQSKSASGSVKGDSKSSDTQQYLASEQSVDREVFIALPTDIQKELVSQWKSQRTRPKGHISNSAVKTKPCNKTTASAAKKKGTLDAFFGKK